MQVKRTRRGSMILLAIGMTILVSFLTTSQLTNLRVAMDARYRTGYARMADTAARSGLDYGYAMLKNTLDSVSMVGPRFATHFWDTDAGSTGGVVADIPPYWQEVLNPQYDRKAYQDRGLNGDTAANHTGNWVGTDSYWTHYHNEPDGDDNWMNTDPADEVPQPFDYDLAKAFYDATTLENSTNLWGTEGGVQVKSTYNPASASDVDDDGIDNDDGGFVAYYPVPPLPRKHRHSRLRNCPRFEESVPVIGRTTYILYPEATYAVAANGHTQCHYLRIQEEFVVLQNSYTDSRSLAEASPWTLRNTLSGDWYLDGHFGDKRWHYYDAFDFSNINSATEVVTAQRGTGGSIVTSRSDFTLDSTGGTATFADYRDRLFERLFYYRFDNTQTQYPHEPGDYTQTDMHLQQESEDNYTVQMFTGIDLDFIDTGDTTSENLKRHDDYSLIKYKTMFKLWITRDEQKNGYGGEAFTPPVTWPVTTNFQGFTYKKWDGAAITGTASDLHPLWVIPRNNTDVPSLPTIKTGLPSNRAELAIDETSLWRPNYLQDFMDNDEDGDSTDALGVLQWPVPYLAMQRGDYDIFDVSSKGVAENTIVPVKQDRYTKFTLWSLGMVVVPNLDRLREIRNFSDTIVAENTQRISDFDVVAKVLYKMDFLVDVRAPDIHDQSKYIDYSEDNDGAEFNGDSYLYNLALNTDDNWRCGDSGTGADKHNPANEPFYASRFIPICDLSTDQSKTVLFEPKGIIMLGQERVSYRASQR